MQPPDWRGGKAPVSQPALIPCFRWLIVAVRNARTLRFPKEHDSQHLRYLRLLARAAAGSAAITGRG